MCAKGSPSPARHKITRKQTNKRKPERLDLFSATLLSFAKTFLNEMPRKPKTSLYGNNKYLRELYLSERNGTINLYMRSMACRQNHLSAPMLILNADDASNVLAHIISKEKQIK